jgi:hypothetical protein
MAMSELLWTKEAQNHKKFLYFLFLHFFRSEWDVIAFILWVLREFYCAIKSSLPWPLQTDFIPLHYSQH